MYYLNWGEYNADGQLGTISICTESLKALAAKGLAPNSEDMLPSISNYLTETIDEIGAHAASLAKERFDLNISLPDKATVYSRVASVIEKETYAESASLETLSNNLKSLHQRHTLAIVLLDVSKLGGDYETLIPPYLNEGYFGNFWLATCPIDEPACLDLVGFHKAEAVIDTHSVTVMHGLENWHDGLTDISKLIRHWKRHRETDENKLIVLPYFDGKSPVILEVLNEIRNLEIDLINLPIEYDQPVIEPINWDEKFGNYPKEIQDQSKIMSALVFDYVVSVIEPEFNENQRAALKAMPEEQKLGIQKYLAKNQSRLSLNAQRDHIRKEVISAVLKVTSPRYSIKFNPNPVKFYKTHFEPWFWRFGLPLSALRKASPNLTRTLNEKKSFPQKK